MLTTKTDGPERPNELDLLQGAPAREQAVIDLWFLVDPLWRARWVIVAATIVFGALGLTASLTSPIAYEASVVMAAVAARPTENPFLMTATTTLRPYIENRGLATQVVTELGLDKPPYDIRPDLAFSKIFTVEELKGTSTLALKARLSDRVLAAKAANRLAELSIGLIRQVASAQIERAKQDVKGPLDLARTEFETAENRLRRFREESQIELVRKDVDTQLGLRGQLLSLLVSIQSEKAELAQSEADLASRRRVDTLTRAIDSDPALMASARDAGTTGKDAMNLQLRDQRVNPVYEAIDEKAASSRSYLAGLERQKAELVDSRKLDGTRLASLSQLYAKEAELSRLELDREIARRVYSDLTTRYETALTQIANRTADLVVIDPAQPPADRASRHTVRNTLLGALLGLVLAPLLVLMFHGVAAVAQRPRRAEGR